MRFALAGFIVLLLDREHVDALGFCPRLHDGFNPVFLLFRRWPLKVLTPAARVGFTDTTGVVFDPVQFRRVDPREAEFLFAVHQLRALASDEVVKVRRCCRHRASAGQGGQHGYQ